MSIRRRFTWLHHLDRSYWVSAWPRAVLCIFSASHVLSQFALSRHISVIILEIGPSWQSQTEPPQLWFILQMSCRHRGKPLQRYLSPEYKCNCTYRIDKFRFFPAVWNTVSLLPQKKQTAQPILCITNKTTRSQWQQVPNGMCTWDSPIWGPLPSTELSNHSSINNFTCMTSLSQNHCPPGPRQRLK